MHGNEPSVDVGFADFRLEVFQKYKLAFESIRELVALASKMTTTKAVSEPLHKVIGWMVGMLSNSLGAVATLTLNGYGCDAMRIARSMYEGRVAVRWLKLHPEAIDDFMAFHWVRQKKLLDLMEKYRPEDRKRIPLEKIRETKSHYASVASRFKDKNTWRSKKFREMAEEAGTGDLYYTFYSWASSLMHFDIGALIMQTELQSKEGKGSVPSFDPAPSWQWLEQAVVIAHGSVLLVINDYNEVAGLGMEREIEASNEAFKMAWQKTKP